MGKWCVHASSFIFDQIVIKVAGNQDRHKSSDEFDFGPLVSMAHLYVFWNEIWPWHIGLRWAIVALWATCLLFYSSVPMVLFDTPGISRCRSQHAVSVESSSLFHHSIYLWFICFPWWVRKLHADRTTNYMFWAIAEAEGEVGIPLSPPPPPPLPVVF